MNILYRTHLELLGFVNNYSILLMNNIVITFLYILLFITFVIWELKLCLSRQWPPVCVCVQHHEWIWSNIKVRTVHSSTHLFWGNSAQHRGVANTRLGDKTRFTIFRVLTENSKTLCMIYVKSFLVFCTQWGKVPRSAVQLLFLTALYLMKSFTYT